MKKAKTPTEQAQFRPVRVVVLIHPKHPLLTWVIKPSPSESRELKGLQFGIENCHDWSEPQTMWLLIAAEDPSLKANKGLLSHITPTREVINTLRELCGFDRGDD